MNCHALMIFTAFISIKVTMATNGEVQLVADLFVNYSTEARPVKNDKDAVEVKFGLALTQIVDVREKSEYFSVSTMLRQYWTDENLEWDPANYNNVTAINISPSKIWKPDIVLYNNVDEDKGFSGSLDQLNNRVIVNHKGEVKWLTPAILSAKCPMNVEYFPFDTQLCTLKFGSWTYGGFKLNMQSLSQDVDMSAYQKHSEWFIDSGILQRNVVTYSCCAEPFPDVTVTITIKRRSLFYLINLVFPMVVISMLTMLSFYLPSESGERIALAITLLLAMTVFMLIVGEIIPPTSDTVPLVAAFFSAVMVEMVFMIIILCYILKLHFKTPSDDPMPGWMRSIILNKLSYTLGIRNRKSTHGELHQNGGPAVGGAVSVNTFKDKELEKNIKQMINKGNGHNGRNALGNGTTITFVKNGKLHRNNDVTNTFENCFLSPTPTPTNQVIPFQPSPTPSVGGDGGAPLKSTDSETAYLKLLSKKFDVIIQRYLDEDEEVVAKEEWRICALTIDKISLIFFAIVFTVTSLGCFMSAPGYTP